MTSDISARQDLDRHTVWQSGRLDARNRRPRLLFGRVYEDNAIEQAAFAPGGRIFCIASGGCTALSLAGEREVVACDINPVQIEYVKRRMAGALPELGTADHVMTFLRRLMPIAGWTRNKLNAFLELGDPNEQESYFRAKLDTGRFRAGLALLLSPLWLRGIYSSALLSSLPPRFGTVLRKRMERCFAAHPNRTNPYARALLLGWDKAPGNALPEGSSATNIQLVADDAATYLERCSPQSFDGLSLSNILDGAGESYRKRLVAAVRRAAQKNAVVVLRSFGEPAPDSTANRAQDDRSMLWGIVDVRPADSL